MAWSSSSPWNLKAEFTDHGASHRVEVEVTDRTRCRVQSTMLNRADQLNETNVMVLRSLIPGA